MAPCALEPVHAVDLRAQAKNAALAGAGAIVPDSFEALEGTIRATYERLVKEGTLVPQPDTPPPSVPLDLEAAKKAGKVTPVKPSSATYESWHRARGALKAMCTVLLWLRGHGLSWLAGCVHQGTPS